MILVCVLSGVCHQYNWVRRRIARELRTGLELLHHAGEESGEGARVDEGAQPAMPPQETLLSTVVINVAHDVAVSYLI
jgi:hypothetical protein